MCRAFLAVAAALSRSSRGRATVGTALSCGLPEAQPTWIDFADGSVSFWRERFARPGVVVATGGPDLAAEARAAGAGTVHFDLYLRKRVGTPSDPADPALMEKRADALFDYAVSVSGCETPLIALNELWGASLPTPLTPTAERYRANVLRFVTRLGERGARPALLVSSEPFTGGDAAAWWRSVGRRVRSRPRELREREPHLARGAGRRIAPAACAPPPSVSKLLAIGIPPARIGIMIGFQTGAGNGRTRGAASRGRGGSASRSGMRWLPSRSREELKLAHVWSWGWAQRDARSNDPDKTLRGVRLALGSRREPVRRAEHPRARARRGYEDRAAGPAGRRALRLRLDPADGVERGRAREGDATTASSR